MKRLIVTLIMLVPFVCGCTDIDARVNISDDKSASVVASVTYRGNIADTRDTVGQAIAANYSKFLDKYYKVETSKSKNLSTLTASKKVLDVDKQDLDLSSLGLKSNLKSGKFIEVKKNFLVKSYNVDMNFDYSKAKNILEIPENVAGSTLKPSIDPQYYNKYSEQTVKDTEFDLVANLDESVKQLMRTNPSQDTKTQKPAQLSDSLVFSIKLPSFASYNNADSVNENIYSWIIKKDEPTVIKLQYVKYNMFMFFASLLLGILLFVYMAKRIIRRDSTKRMDNIKNIV